MTAPTTWSSELRPDGGEEAGPVSGSGAEQDRLARLGVMSSRLTGVQRLVWCGVWLVFLGYPIGDIVSRPHSAIWVVAAWASLGVFVALYLRTMWVVPHGTGRARVGWLAALVVVALAMVVGFGAPWAGIVIYLGVATGSVLPTRPALATLAGLVAFTAGYGLAVGVRLSDIAFLCFLTGALGVSMLGLRRLLQLITELDEARHEVARLTAAEERLRFSRDLHDVLGHSLSVVALKSQVARRTLASDPDAARSALADVEAVARQSLSDVRQLVSGYRQQSLADELSGADELLVAAGITPHMDRPVSLPTGETARLLAWAVREGTTNVIRHSRASQCRITLTIDDASAGLEIVDDGVGDSTLSSGGSGLRGLRERMEHAGGHLDSGSCAEGGFRLAVQLPAVPVERDPVEGDRVEGDSIEGDPIEGDPIEGVPVESVPVESSGSQPSRPGPGSAWAPSPGARVWPRRPGPGRRVRPRK